MIRDHQATVRGYRAGDEHGIQEAFAEVFGVTRRLAEWKWKFEQSPAGSHIVLAVDDGGRVVCQYAAIVLDVQWFGESLRVGQIVDVLSRGRAGLGRRGGPFLRTVETFLEQQRRPGGLAFIYGFPGIRHQRLGEVGGLYNPTTPIARWSRSIDPARSLSDAPARRFSDAFDATAIDRLWTRAAPRYRVIAARDARWFAWRYAARPGGDYLQVGLHRAGVPRAWAVLKVVGERAHWVDLVWDGEERSDLERLAERIARSAGERNCRSLELWLAGDPAAEGVFAGLGFVSAPDPERRLSAIVFDPRVELATLATDFYFTLGDSDHL